MDVRSTFFMKTCDIKQQVHQKQQVENTAENENYTQSYNRKKENFKQCRMKLPLCDSCCTNLSLCS